MKHELSALSGRYLAALRKHLSLRPSLRPSLEPACELGQHAVAIGLETLDVARIHERALARLEADSSKDGFIARAEVFFNEVIKPIEEAHRVGPKATTRLSQLNKTLGQRTAELATVKRSIKRAIAQRKTVAGTLERSGEHYTTLLKESLALQKHLQQLTHRILTAQEDKRKKISEGLQNDTAQTLLGIKARLWTMKKTAGRKATSLQKEITSTQRLVDTSMKNLDRFACEAGKHHEP